MGNRKVVWEGWAGDRSPYPDPSRPESADILIKYDGNKVSHTEDDSDKQAHEDVTGDTAVIDILPDIPFTPPKDPVCDGIKHGHS